MPCLQSQASYQVKLTLFIFSPSLSLFQLFQILLHAIISLSLSYLVTSLDDREFPRKHENDL